MVYRCKYNTSSEVGAYAQITNSYALLPCGISDSFMDAVEAVTNGRIPIITCNIAGTAIVGRLTTGNKNGLIVPSTTSHMEMQELKRILPEKVELAQVEEKYSALGNVISCNDRVALVHPELDPETLQVIGDILQVETFPAMIGNEPLVGSYSVFTNKGGVVSPAISQEQLQELKELIGVDIKPATVNRGSGLVGAGVCATDFGLLCGWESTALEVANLMRVFKIDERTGVDLGDSLDVNEDILGMIL